MIIFFVINLILGVYCFFVVSLAPGDILDLLVNEIIQWSVLITLGVQVILMLFVLLIGLGVWRVSDHLQTYMMAENIIYGSLTLMVPIVILMISTQQGIRLRLFEIRN